MLNDDGVVYLNGTEVARRNLPEGSINYETLAIEDLEATTYEEVDLTNFSHLLTQGSNVIAVEVHQFSTTSSDLVWDGELTYPLAFDPDDQDGDGMPRDWEIANGLDDADPSDTLLDSDGDGRSNHAEFLAGTDPQSSASYFHIRTLDREPDGSITLRWDSVPGKTYRVSYSFDLGQWFSFGVAGDLNATGTVLEFTDPSAALPDRRYYRIMVVP